MIVTVPDTQNIVYLYEPAHTILVLIAYVEMPLIKAHADAFSGARGLIFGLSHLHPYFVYVSTGL